MVGPWLIISYALAKFAAYSAWATYGVRLSRPSSQLSERIRSGVGLGALRWVIGFGFGFGVFFVTLFFPVERVWSLYFLIYIPIRFVEWGIIASMLASDAFRPYSKRMLIWIVGGIVVSVLVDLVHPDMIEETRFCVGRCLC